MEVRVARASAVIVQRVAPADADWFLEWQRGVSAAAAAFPGYRSTDVYPPAEGEREEWVVVIQLDDAEALRQWLDSPVRAQWVERLRARVGDFDLTTLPGGFGGWFAGLGRGPGGTGPPSWKMALTVLLALYPTVMLLTLFPGPYLRPLGFALAMLIGNALSISILQWAVMPVLTRLLGPWLEANSASNSALSVTGLFLILLVLAGLAVLFHLAKIGGT